MSLLDRHIFSEWLKAFGLAVAATLGVLFIHELYDRASDLVSYGASPAQVGLYFCVLLPGFLPVVLPLSQFVSLLFAMGNLHRHGEIIAMRAAGLSLWRIARPLWVGGAVLAVAMWVLDTTIVPWSTESSLSIFDQLHNASEKKVRDANEVGMIPEFTYDNVMQHRRWLMNHFSDLAFRAKGVHIYELDEFGHDKRFIGASEGYFDDGSGHWVLLHGKETFFDPSTHEAVQVSLFDKKEFPEFTETPAVMKMLHQRPDDLSIDELRFALTLAPPGGSPAMSAYQVRFDSLMARPFICLLIVGMAVPFAVAGVRVNPMVGVSKSIGLFFAYYVVAGLCGTLGNQQLLPAVIAAWLPNVMMFAFAVWLFRRAE